MLTGSTDVEAWLAHASANAGLPEPSARHFREDWLGGEALRGIGPDVMLTTFRDGLVKALTEARDAGLPMSFVWVSPSRKRKTKPSAGDDETPYLDIGHVKGANGVTVVITTSSRQMQRDAPA